MYQVWQVFERDKRAKFYVVNQETKHIQSSWGNYIEAKQVCDKLNNVARFSAVEGE